MKNSPYKNFILLNDYDFNVSPQRFQFDGEFVWVVSEPPNHILTILKDKCAHMGNHIKPTSNGFVCPTHFWKYDFRGKNMVKNSPSLETVEFTISNDVLYIDFKISENIFPEVKSSLDGNEKLELISHATFLLSVDNVKILFDPWIKGDAYWGSWTLHPQYDFDFKKIQNLSGVVITHSHPDHFHQETLDLIDRDTPIYLPPFPSKIMPKILERMKFRYIREMPWESNFSIGDNSYLSFLRPNSIWEDSSVLIKVKDWVWLNQNDAGTQFNDSLIPKSIDLLTSAFDIGASGYPLTWNITSSRQDNILKNQKKQLLSSILQRCSNLNAKYYAPFAGFWRHSLLDHQEFIDRIPHVNLIDLEMAFKESHTKLLATIPSSLINLKSMNHEFSAVALSNIEKYPNLKKFDFRINKTLTNSEIEMILEEKMNLLKNMSLACNSENVLFQIQVPDTNINVRTLFGNNSESEIIHIRAEISREVALLYCLGDEQVTWDNIAIGYLAKWSRTPDIYPANFMKLIQMGYVPEFNRDNSEVLEMLEDFSIAEIIEKDQEMAFRIFSRAGLPCLSCTRATSETILQALVIHNISNSLRRRVMCEVNALMNNGQSK